MHRVVRVMALWLAAFWLPLTMHCQLTGSLAGGTHCDEVAGCCQGPGDCREGPCHLSICKTIETGKLRLNELSVSVPAASLIWTDRHGAVALRRLGPLEATLSEATGAPPGLDRIWQFVFRAAASPRAPSARC